MSDSYTSTMQPPLVRPATEPRHTTRFWQGIPAIECSIGGRLWAAFYSGGDDEGPGNYALLATSSDAGASWSEPLLAVEHADPLVRIFDPCLWHDPMGRLWLFWGQSRMETEANFIQQYSEVWAAVCEDSEQKELSWQQPRFIAPGVMMNKPIVRSNGEWLLPIAEWVYTTANPHRKHCRFSHVYVSTDHGDSFQLRGSADVPNRSFDEHMLVERRDGSLWMLVRTYYGIGESVSYDGGATWSPGKPATLGGPCSRFFITRLDSGRLLLVNHYGYKGRSHLSAMLSEDDGSTWGEALLLDERPNVSYPDGVQNREGQVFIIYDRGRKQHKEILLAVFTEDDLLQNQSVQGLSRLRQLVNRG